MRQCIRRAGSTFMCLLALLAMHEGSAQITVFSDDFNTDTDAAWTTSGSLGGSAWTVFRSGDDLGARRNTGPLQLECTNDVSGATNLNGYVFASTPTASFSSPYTTTLNQGGMVTWTFNMQQIRTDPSGFDVSNYGIAVILAGETASTNTTGNGYAVVLGQSGSIDPVRLARYTTGITGNAGITNIIISNTTGLADFGAEYLSIKVTYNPCLNDQWELFVRDDGGSFADPLSGVLTSQGTASDNTYTGTALGMMAAYWQGSTTAAQTAFFDNMTVSVLPTPTAVLGTDPSVCQGNTTGMLSYSLQGSADQFSINYSAAAEAQGFVDVTNVPLSGNPLILTVPGGAALGDYMATITFSSSVTGCTTSALNFEVHVIDCTAPFIQWVPLAEGEVTGNCMSATNCEPAMGNVICYGLEYTPSFTGTVTSYTTGFLLSCSSLGNPVVSNLSCYMTGGSSVMEDCEGEMAVLVNASGNTGTFMVTQNVPIIIHQLCLSIPSDEAIDITEFFPGSTSIDLAGGGFESEELGYTSVSASWDLECVTLPLRWLDFQVSKKADLITRLEWMTADEINNSHFDVQRSNDQGRTFTSIGVVPADSGDDLVKRYEFIDRHAASGMNYYRLRQVDYDGRFDFSPVRSVSFSSGRMALTAWPNPAVADLEISIHTAVGTVQAGLFDITGRQVWQKTFTGEDIRETLDISFRNTGVYTLVADDGMERLVRKVVIW